MRSPGSTAQPQRGRRLVYVPQPPAQPCPVCGFDVQAPGEAIAALGRLAHPACVADAPIAMRGGC